jgi:hypothetical protein
MWLGRLQNRSGHFKEEEKVYPFPTEIRTPYRRVPSIITTLTMLPRLRYVKRINVWPVFEPMTPQHEDGGSAYRQHDGSLLLNKYCLFPYVLPAPLSSPPPPPHDLIALITSDEEHIKYYEGFVNKKQQQTSGRILKFVWNGLERSPTAAQNHETSDGSTRLSSQTTTRLLPAGETRSSPSEPSSTHAKTRPMRCEKALLHQEWRKGRWIVEDLSMALTRIV